MEQIDGKITIKTILQSDCVLTLKHQYRLKNIFHDFALTTKQL